MEKLSKKKSFLHGWQGKVVQALHLSSLHGHCTSVQTNLLQLCYAYTVLLHGTTALYVAFTWELYAFCNVQSAIAFPYFEDVSARKDAKIHILPPISLLIAILKLAAGHVGTTETGLILAAPGAGASLCWAKDSRPDGNTHFVSHRVAEALWASDMCPVLLRAARIYPR